MCLMGRNSKLSNVYLFIVFAILYMPILYLIYYSFNSGGTMQNFEGFTLEWYEEVFADTRLLIIVLNTFVIALLSAVASTILGVRFAANVTRILYCL